MKRITPLLIVPCVALALAPPRAPAAPAANESRPAPVITERGPDHKVWTRVLHQTNKNGRVVESKSSYTELATGMHYWKDRQWVDAQPVFEIFPGGIVARQCRHQVVLALNLNTEGSVDLLCEGQHFRSHIFGLAYTDAASGDNTLFATVKDCTAELIAPNQVLYRDAFEGDVKADVVYTLTREGLSQWVLLRENPPPPENYKISSRSARIEVWTEWVAAPVPVKRPQVLRVESDARLRATMADPDLRDEELSFGTLFMGPGAAFPLENDAPEGGYEPGIPIGKLWIRAADPQGGPERTFLIEQAEYPSIQPRLQRLPQAAAIQRGNKNAQMAAANPPPAPAGRNGDTVRRNRSSVARTFPPAPPSSATAPHTLLARSLSQLAPTNTQLALRLPAQPFDFGRAFVLDYTLMNAGNLTNYVFADDSTTFINGAVNLYGTTVLEGGAVVKNTNGIGNRLLIKGPLDCRTQTYRPAYFVGKDDNTLGETISGSTGNPTTNNYGYYLDFSGNTNVIDLHDVRLRRAYYALTLNSSSQLTVRHAQISSPYAAIVGNGSFLEMRNVLVEGGKYFIGGSAKLAAEQLTLHRITYLRSSGYTNAFLTNTLIISVTNLLQFTGGSDVVTNLDDTGIFQTVGTGARYLSASSSYRNAGVTTINSNLLADLRNRTTCPPVVLSNALISTDTTLTPQAQRDTDTPDLGYHYDPIDFAIGSTTLSNATLTVQAGVALAAIGPSYALSLESGARVISVATAANPNCLFRYNSVQEQANTSWSIPGPLLYAYHSVAVPIQATFRFTHFGPLSGTSYHLLGGGASSGNISFSDCQFYGGQLENEDVSLALTNCLLDRVTSYFWAFNNQASDASFHSHNSTYRRGVIDIVHYNLGSWTLTNNLFDQTFVSQFGDVENGHNGYVTNADCVPLYPSTAPNVTNHVSPVYEAGDLGRFYLPTTSPFINGGSTYATNVGLYHFTTTTNQWKETNSVVDIGFHYVAVNSSGLPVDTDGDGWPDYGEDANGNGSWDTGETKWMTSGAGDPKDTNGDGMSDWMELLLGRNRLVAAITNDVSGTLNLRRYTPLK